MNRQSEKPLSLLTLLLVLAWGGWLAAGRYNRVASLGDPLPRFTALPATDGSRLSSSDLTEDVVVLVFLANHCPWVRGMDRDLVRLVEEMRGRSVRIIGVSVNHREADRLPAMRRHAARVGYNFSYLYDESQALGRALGATRTPEYFVFNRERKLVYMGLLHDSPAFMRGDGTVHYSRGEPTRFYVREAILATLADRPVATPETRAHGCSLEYEP